MRESGRLVEAAQDAGPYLTLDDVPLRIDVRRVDDVAARHGWSLSCHHGPE